MIIHVALNPFKYRNLTLFMRVYRFIFEVGRWFPGILKPIIKAGLFEFARRNGSFNEVDSSVMFEMALDSQLKPIQFSGNQFNSQLQAIYFRRYSSFYELDIESCLELFRCHMNCFVDVGANWGYFCGKVLASDLRTRVIAFEPATSSFADLCLLHSAFSPFNVDFEIHKLAVGDSSGEGILRQTGLESGMATLDVLDFGDSRRLFHSEQVALTDLDSLILSKETVIKIDVEGYEINVLRGAFRLLTDQKPAIIFEHWHAESKDLQHFQDYFLGLGYIMYQVLVRQLTPDVLGYNLISRRSSVELMIRRVVDLPCDRRYNLLAVHPDTVFYKIISPHLTN